MGISNTLACAPGFIGPSLVGIVTNEGTAQQWQLVFYGLVIVEITGAVLFTIMGSGKRQGRQMILSNLGQF